MKYSFAFCELEATDNKFFIIFLWRLLFPNRKVEPDSSLSRGSTIDRILYTVMYKYHCYERFSCPPTLQCYDILISHVGR